MRTTNNKYSGVKKYALSALMLIAVTATLADTNKVNHSRLVIILLDETDSFGSDKQHGVAKTLYWEDALRLSCNIVKALKEGDKLIVLAINEKGFEEEDIIIDLQQFEMTFMRAKVRKNKIAREVLSLKRRKDTYKATDILGALFQAAYFAEKNETDETIVFCFSDMRQEPRWPTQREAEGLRFPKNSAGYFFFVDASGRENWDRMINIWKPILSMSGLCEGDNINFFQYGESQNKLFNILKEW